jgi:hypothetical protein
MTLKEHSGRELAEQSRHAIVWDSANLKIKNDDDANRFLHQDYRKGWT